MLDQKTTSFSSVKSTFFTLYVERTLAVESCGFSVSIFTNSVFVGSNPSKIFSSAFILLPSYTDTGVGKIGSILKDKSNHNQKYHLYCYLYTKDVRLFL